MKSSEWMKNLENKFTSLTAIELCSFLEEKGVKVESFSPGEKGSITFIDETECVESFSFVVQMNTVSINQLLNQEKYNDFSDMAGAA